MLTDGQKIAGIIMSAMACTILAIVGVVYGDPKLMDMAYAFGGVFGLLVGNPIFQGINKAIKKLIK